MKRSVILAVTLCAGAAFGGIIADAPKAAAAAGIGLTRIDKVPGSFKAGPFEARVTLKNLTEEPLRGYFAVKIAESDEEDPKFKTLASAFIDISLASVSPDEVEYTAKGEIPAEYTWRDLKVVIEARDYEIVVFSGFVEGAGKRPDRIRQKVKALRKYVPGTLLSPTGKLVFGEDFFPEGFRTAFVTSGGRKGNHVKSAELANWNIRGVYRNDAQGWGKLIADIDKLDAVVSLAGLPKDINLQAIADFVAQGGMLWVNGIEDAESIAGLAVFSTAANLPTLKVREFGDAEADNHLLRPGSPRNWHRDSWELQYPAWGNLVDYTPNTYMELPRDGAAKFWTPIACVKKARNELTVSARLRHKRGVVYLSSTPSADAQFYANLRFHAGLQRKGLSYRHHSVTLTSVCFPEAARLRDPAVFSVCYGNLDNKPADYRLTVKAEAADGTRTVWKTFKNMTRTMRDHTISVSMDSFALHGETRYTMTFEDLTKGYKVTKDCGVAQRRPYLHIKPPFYRGWVSERRATAAVKIGAVVYDDDAVGKKVSLETYDTKGRLMDRQEGVVRQYARANDRSVWFQVPVPADAPPGEYRLVARVDRNGQTVEQVSKFEIRPVIPKQVFVDQDGTLMREGERFYGFGTYHLGLMDDPIGPWTYDTNRNEEVIAPEALKDDGTPFTLWDVGINFTQCWEQDWAVQFTTNIARLSKLDPNMLVHALEGRSKFDPAILGTNARAYRVKTRQRIADDPAFYQKLIEKNDARAKKAAKKGMLFCLEMGLPMYYQMLVPAPFRKPWEKLLRCQRDDYAEIRKIIRDVLADDHRGIVGGWYVLDEGGSAPLIDLQSDVAREEDELHPLMMLGDVAGLHKVVDIGIDQVHPDHGRVKDQNRLHDLYNWGLHNRGRIAPHGGSIICCHRAADEANTPDQSFDTLFTLELSAIMTGLNGSMWYAWKENGRIIGPYGALWSFKRPRDLKEVCDRVKALEPYFLGGGRGTCAKTRDGRVRARICGNQAVGQVVLLANFERNETMSATLHLPELAGKTLDPMFEQGAPVTVNGKGDFTVQFKPDASRVFKVRKEEAK